MQSIPNILKNSPYLKETVNSYINNSSNTVNSIETVNVWEKIKKLFEEENITPEGKAIHLSEKLHAPQNIRYYELLIKNNPERKIFDALHITLERYKRTDIALPKVPKSIYFFYILKKWGLKIKFK